MVEVSFSLFLSNLLSCRRAQRMWGQREDLVKGRLIGDKRSQDQAFSCLTQGGKGDLKDTAYSVIMIEADTITIRYSNQEKIEKDLYGG